MSERKPVITTIRGLVLLALGLNISLVFLTRYADLPALGDGKLRELAAALLKTCKPAELDGAI